MNEKKTEKLADIIKKFLQDDWNLLQIYVPYPNAAKGIGEIAKACIRPLKLNGVNNVKKQQC